jgi:hypothetical protein
MPLEQAVLNDFWHLGVGAKLCTHSQQCFMFYDLFKVRR